MKVNDKLTVTLGGQVIYLILFARNNFLNNLAKFATWIPSIQLQEVNPDSIGLQPRLCHLKGDRFKLKIMRKKKIKTTKQLKEKTFKISSHTKNLKQTQKSSETFNKKDDQEINYFI